MPYENNPAGIALMESHVGIVISYISPFGVWAVSTLTERVNQSHSQIDVAAVLSHMADFGWLAYRFDVPLALLDNPHQEVVSLQLTDEGRILKALASVQAYQAYINDKLENEVRRQRLNDILLESNIVNGTITRRLYYSQVAIALATTAAALYYTAELFDFYESHLLSWLYAAYLVFGVLIGIPIGILLHRAIRFRKSSQKQPPAVP